MIGIVLEKEACTQEVLYTYREELEGFETILSHMLVSSPKTSTPLTAEEMITTDIQQLQPNTIYNKCAFDKAYIDTWNALEWSSLLAVGSCPDQYTLTLNRNLIQQSDYHPFPDLIKVAKDLILKHEGSEIGWYNKNINILWLSDILHSANFIEPIFTKILKAVNHIRTYGFLKKEPLTIGADPEFEIIDSNGYLVSAVSTLGSKYELGHDGVEETGEMRPPPGRTPLILTRNIKRLVRKLARSPAGKYKVFAGGGTKVSTGGHLHFGIQKLPPNARSALWRMLSEPVLKHQRGVRLEYGQAMCTENGSDVVRTDNGKTVEWRALPSFIINQEITEAVICVAYCILKAVVDDGFTTPAYIGAATYRRLSLYSVYAPQIEKFIELFVDDGVGQLEQRDILEEWNMSKDNRKFSVNIYSDNEWIRSFFKPVNVKLRKSVNIFIRFADWPDGVTCFGLSPAAETILRTFCDKHLVPLSGPDPDATVRTMKTSGAEFVITFPVLWTKGDRKTVLNELKSVIKEIVLCLGEEY